MERNDAGSPPRNVLPVHDGDSNGATNRDVHHVWVYRETDRRVVVVILSRSNCLNCTLQLDSTHSFTPEDAPPHANRTASSQVVNAVGHCEKCSRGTVSSGVWTGIPEEAACEESKGSKNSHPKTTASGLAGRLASLLCCVLLIDLLAILTTTERRETESQKKPRAKGDEERGDKPD